VAVIDDEQDILEGMQITLEDWGCKVLTALSGDVMNKKIKSHHCEPDLIICDLRLVNETGTEVVKQLRNRLGTNIPSILITGDTAPQRLTLAKQSEATVLYKPVETHQLFQTIINLTQ